jgi:site-specific recombinase
MRWLAARLRHGLSGIGGNVTIGFLLGMMPVVGKFLGVPLEVRHVTLSTGSLTFAALSLGGNPLSHEGFLAAVGGIGVVLLLNFGVSFALALGVAMRAREVERGASRLFGAIVRRFFRSPGEFFFPPGA